MSLSDLLVERKSAILEQWRGCLVESYPDKTSQFLKRQKNRFANPMGHAIFHGTQGVLDELLSENREEELRKSLDEIIRVRAIQEFSVSQALAFVFRLKEVVFKVLGDALDDAELLKEYVQFESEIDRLALLAFEIYSECRDQIGQIRVDEQKRHYHKLLERVNLIFEERHQKSKGDGSSDKEGGIL